MWLSFDDSLVEILPTGHSRDELTVRAVAKRDIEQLFPGAPIEQVRASRADAYHYLVRLHLVRLRRDYVAETFWKVLREMA